MKTLYIYLSNIFHVTGTEITVYESLCQKTGSRAATLNYGFHPDLSYWLFVRLRKKKKLSKSCLPHVVKDRCPLLKVIPKQIKTSICFQLSSRYRFPFFFYDVLKHNTKIFSVYSLYANYQDSDKLPSF